MAAGDLIYADYQYEFRGLLFGSGTDYITTNVTGLLDMAGVRDADIDKAHDHGSIPGMALYTKRVITFDVAITGSGGLDIEEKLQDAKRVFQLPRKKQFATLHPFVFKRPGGPKKMLTVRCDKRDFPSTYELARGLGKGSVQLTAPDPVIYSLVENTRAVTLAPAATSGQVAVYNAGDYEEGAFPVLDVTGPFTNPTFQNSTDGNQQIKLTCVIAAGTTLRIKTKTLEVQTSTDGGVTWVDHFEYVNNDSQWWSLLPGENIVVYNRAATNNGANSTMTVRWQDAWS